MRLVLTLMAVGALLQQPPRYSVIQDGEAHGDPPYMLEEGWEPLLNGKDLSGWKAPNSQFPTPKVIYSFDRIRG